MNRWQTVFGPVSVFALALAVTGEVCADPPNPSFEGQPQAGEYDPRPAGCISDRLRKGGHNVPAYGWI